MDKLRGHTYMIKGGTNTGVYTFRDGSTLLIDPGHSKPRGKKLIRLLANEKLRPRYCYSTHEHGDHFEAYLQIKEDCPGVDFFCHEHAKPFLEQPYIGDLILYSAVPNKVLGNVAKPFTSYIEDIKSLSSGKVKINDREFDLIHTPGHTMGSGSVMTEDKVLFVGDSIFDERIMDKYKIPFIIDYDRFLASLDILENLDFEIGVIAHAREVYSKEELSKIIGANRRRFLELKEQAYELLSGPYSREELLRDLMILYDLQVNSEIYHYNNATIGSILTSMVNKFEIDYSVEDGRIIYYR